MNTHQLPRRIPEFGGPGAHQERRIVTVLFGGLGVLAIAYGAFPAVAQILAVLIVIGVIAGLVLTARRNAREGARP